MNTGQGVRMEEMIEQLAAQARMLGNILSASADHIYMFDPAGRYLFANKAGAAAMGLRPADMIGKNWRELGLPQNVMGPFDLKRQAVMETGRTMVEEADYPTVEGLRRYEYILTPLFDDRGQVEAVVCNARDFTNRLKMEEKLQQTEGNMRALSLQLMHVQEAERRRIARELHDEIGQMLSIIKVNIQQSRRAPDPETQQLLLDRSIAVLGQTLQQIRRLSHDLRPSILDDLGLVAALRWFVDYRMGETEVAANFTAETTGERLPADLETACFRVVQEALTNILQHARSRRVDLELRQTPASLRLTITDDGVGFNLREVREQAVRGAHLGLLGMQERILSAGGRLHIDAARGRGCRIEIEFSLSPAPPAAGE